MTTVRYKRVLTIQFYVYKFQEQLKLTIPIEFKRMLTSGEGYWIWKREEQRKLSGIIKVFIF